MAHVQVIIGSTRPGRVGPKIAKWYVGQLELPKDSTVEIIDLADVNLPLLDEPYPASMKKYQNEHTKQWAKIVGKADAYVLVTPEYNHAAPASLTNAICYLQAEWAYKPVAFVGYGGLGATRAVENLVSMASELQMVPLRERVSVNEPWVNVNEAGEVTGAKGDPNGQFAELVKWADATKVLRK